MNYPKRALIADLVAPGTTLGTMSRPTARLVIEAECTTCGPISFDTENGISIVQLALRTLDCHGARSDPEWHD